MNLRSDYNWCYAHLRVVQRVWGEVIPSDLDYLKENNYDERAVQGALVSLTNKFAVDCYENKVWLHLQRFKHTGDDVPF